MKAPTKKEYNEALMTFLPLVYPCGKCKWPVQDGYICMYCRDTEPYKDKKGNDVRDWK